MEAIGSMEVATTICTGEGLLYIYIFQLCLEEELD